MTDTVATPKAQVEITAARLSPGDLLQQVVSGAVKAPPEAVPAKAIPSLKLRLAGLVDARAVIGAAGVTLGLVIGAGSAALLVPRGESAASIMVKIEADIGASRSESARLSSEVKRLAGALVSSGERAAEEAKAIRADLTQRIAKAEQSLTTKMASVAERHDAADKDQAIRIAALGASIEKRFAGPAPQPAPVPQAAKPVVTEPVQTGSLGDGTSSPDNKPKPGPAANWAVRDVYDGVAILEDRKHRLIEVARGDIVPGVGRAEAIERRGRNWVVVTRDSVITPQEW